MAHPGGAPTKYDPEKLDAIKVAYSLGITDKDLAALLDVNPDTIYNWDSIHPEFSETRKKAKENADFLVEQSLFKRACGFTRKIDRVGKDEVFQCEEEVPPDTTACIFWLKNRRPSKWRDRQEHEVKANIYLIPVVRDDQSGGAVLEIEKEGERADTPAVDAEAEDRIRIESD